MSLRAASFEDDWRRLFLRNYAEFISSITLADSQSIENNTVAIGKGITALVGGNGVGKSTFAHAIVEGLLNVPAAPDLLAQRGRIDGSSISYNFIKGGDTHNRQVLFLEEKVVQNDSTIHCTWIDPSLFSTMCRQQIYSDKAFEEVLDGIEAKVFSDKDVKLASYIVGKEYDRCEVWEITEYGPFEAWPYFKVTIGQVTYGSETMGQGELALLSTLWAVQRSPENAFVVIEEPETHVSARSQLSFMDFIAREGSTRSMSFLLTTHSSVILSRIPLGNILLLIASGARSSVISPPREYHLSSLLGGSVAYKALVVVEDESAKEFCRTIIEFVDPDFARQITYVVADGGESEIVKILSTMPKVNGWATLIGCFDGDQRDRHSKLELQWPYVFLPGVVAPDQILKNETRGIDKQLIANELRVNIEDLTVALSSAAGVDFHDWTRVLSDALGLEQAALVAGLTRVWPLGGNRQAQDFVSEVRKAL